MATVIHCKHNILLTSGMARSVLCLMWFLNHLQSGCYHCLCISVSISMQGPLFHERYMDYTDRTVCDLVKSTAKCICRHCMQESIMDMSRGNTIRKKKMPIYSKSIHMFYIAATQSISVLNSLAFIIIHPRLFELRKHTKSFHNAKHLHREN